MKTRKRRILSPQQEVIAWLFLDDTHVDYPRRRLFGAEVMRLTGLPSSRVYPALDNLRSRGILDSEQEPYTYGGTGRRIFYMLSDVEAGQAALAEAEEYRKRARPNRDRPEYRADGRAIPT